MNLGARLMPVGVQTGEFQEMGVAFAQLWIWKKKWTTERHANGIEPQNG